MNTLNIFNKVLTAIVLTMVAAWLMAPAVSPAGFGNLLYTIDQARWGSVEHGYEYDYTREP